MRRVDNPPNPFLSEQREYLGPPPTARLELYEERAASILTHNDSSDIPFRWTVNPYRGCQHACAYCYARRTHEYLGLGAGTDFESRIIVKINAPELLAAELGRASWRRETLGISGVTDPYQPLEAVYGLTRRCLKVCLEAANPVGLVTKSCLVARDVELLAALNRRAGVWVNFSIPFADQEAARKLEPHAPSPARQFEAMRQVAGAGVPVGVLLAPVIPGLNDRDIPRILEQAVACGALTASYAPVRLPGSVGEVFLSRIRAEMPDAAARIEQRTRELRGGRLNDPRFGYRMQANGAYWESVTRLFETTATRLGLDCGQAWRKHTCAAPEPPAGPRQLSLFE